MVEAYSENQSKQSKNKLVVFSFIAVLLVAAASASGYFWFTKSSENATNPVVAEVGKDKIYLNEYNDRLNTSAMQTGASESNKNMSGAKETVLDELVDTKIVEKELKSRNITVTDDELAKKANEVFPNYDKQSDAKKQTFKKYVWLTVGNEKLKETVSTWKKGFILYCRYDQTNQMSSPNPSEQEKAEQTKKKETSKAYAKDYCEKMKERLAKGQSDYQKELENIMTDKTIGAESFNPYRVNYGNQFDKESFTLVTFQMYYDDFQQIQGLKSNNSYYLLNLKNTEDKKDWLYGVVYLSSEGKDGETADYGTWFNNLRDKSGVKVYKERIK